MQAAGAGANQGLGLFINTLPIRIRLGARSAERCLQDTHSSLGALLSHEHASLSLAQRCSGVPRGTPLFSALLNYRYSTSRSKDVGHVWQGIQMLAREARTNFPITMSIDDMGKEFQLVAQVPVGIGAQRLCEHLQAALVAVVSTLESRSQRLMCELEGSSEAERGQLRQWGGDAQPCYRTRDTVHRLIEAQVLRAPQSTALIFGETQLSYEELNTRANRLAHRLIALGVKPESRVGLALERSMEVVVGLLAILKAGGAYVPLDPRSPAERLSYLVEDSGIGLLLTHSTVAARLPIRSGLQVLQLDAFDVSGERESDPAVEVHPENLAYVIYTSGSTGRPKGAQLSHRNVVRLLAATQKWFHFDERDVWTLFHSYAFDFSVWEIFGSLCHGSRLVVVPYEVSRSPEEFLTLLRRQRVTVLNQTPSAFKQLLQVPSLYESASSDLALRVVIFGGEALDTQSLRPWLEHFGDEKPRLTNMYGITETTVHVTYRPITKEDLDDSRSPIGERIVDLGLRVLDSHLSPTPIGVAGELYVAGDGLSRGYLYRSGLTSERFIADPFGEIGDRLYRTGDRVRWNGTGELEYLGRVDSQVKIRGFRIELGEIEAQLLLQPRVREAVLVAKESPSGTRLVAYVLCEADAEIEVAAIRGNLAQVLPDYMVPSAIVVLQKLPLNANGKLDREALPEPEYVGTEQYQAPQGELEETLAAIWSDVLGVERVGRGDNFFELGGDSILSLQIVARARSVGWKLTPRQIFERQILSQLAAVIEPVNAASTQNETTPSGDVPLLPIQQWFFEQAVPVRHHWNQAVLLRMREPLERARLTQALQRMMAHHDGLRLRYRQADSGQWEQRYASLADGTAQELLWVHEAADAAQITAICAQGQRSLNLSEGPLLRAVSIAAADGTHRLLLVVHHLVVDGVSWRILLEDLQSTYQQAGRINQSYSRPRPAATSAGHSGCRSTQASRRKSCRTGRRCRKHRPRCRVMTREAPTTSATCRLRRCGWMCGRRRRW